MGVRVRGTRDGPPRVDRGPGHCRYRRPVVYLSVGVERAQRHGLVRDPHRAAFRPAHRARDRPVGRSGSENVGVWQMTCSLLRMGKRSRAPYDDN